MFLFGPYVAASLLWYITVSVTQDHHIEWYEAAKWMILAAIVGLITFGVLSLESLGLPESVALIGGASARVAAMIYILWREFRGYGTGKVLQLIGIYLGWKAASIGFYYWLQTI